MLIEEGAEFTGSTSRSRQPSVGFIAVALMRLLNTGLNHSRHQRTRTNTSFCSLTANG